MATSNYDVNLQLALATTAVHEGDYATARDFLADAQRLATDRVSRPIDRRSDGLPRWHSGSWVGSPAAPRPFRFHTVMRERPA